MNLTQHIEADTENQAAVFSALADPTRLKLVKLLRRQRDPDALCVNALASLLGITQSAVSQHLRVLRATGLVKGERRGYRVHYFINPEGMEYCRKLISAVLSAGVDEGDEDPCQGLCPDTTK
jgi:DNA-binding transcriptional ArsR family regulator